MKLSNLRRQSVPLMTVKDDHLRNG